MTYKIIRFTFEDNHPDNHRIIKTGLTLEEAKAHCNDPSSRGEGWFDGFQEEQ